MDGTDFRILAALHRDARASYDALGKEIGMTGNAVKSRLQRLREEGVLRGFAAVPASGALDLREALLRFESVEDLHHREPEIIRGAPDIGRVSHVDVGVDGSVTLHAYFRDESDFERLERAAANLVGKAPTKVRKLPARAVSDAPSLLDLRIVRALQGDGRKTLSRIGDDAGVTYKTLRKHLRELDKSGALTVRPVVSPAEAQGLTLFETTAFLEDADARQGVLELLPEDAIVVPSPDAQVVRVLAAQDNLREAQSAVHRLRRADGVDEAWFGLATRHPFPDALGPTLDARINALAQTRLEEARPVPVPLSRN